MTMLAGLVARYVAPYLLQLALAGGALAIAGGTLWGYGLHKFNSGFNEGHAAAIREIAAEDQEAVNARDRAFVAMHACRAAGGVWRPATGECQGR